MATREMNLFIGLFQVLETRVEVGGDLTCDSLFHFDSAIKIFLPFLDSSTVFHEFCINNMQVL